MDEETYAQGLADIKAGRIVKVNGRTAVTVADLDFLRSLEAPPPSREQLAGRIAELTRRGEDLESGLVRAEADLSRVGVDLSKAEADLSTEQSRSATLEKEKATLETEKSALQGQITTLQGQLTAAQEQLTAAQKAAKANEAKVAGKTDTGKTDTADPATPPTQGS